MRSSAGVVAAIVVAGIAFLSYRATMLPGLDLGDSASFQVRAGSPTITPRDGYPLYFAVGSRRNIRICDDWPSGNGLRGSTRPLLLLLRTEAKHGNAQYQCRCY